MKYCIMGHHGFLGSALAKRIGEFSSYPEEDTEVIFYLSSVTHIPFEKNPDYHMNRVITDFLWLLPYCKERKIKFIYASSALVYELEKDIPFSRCKKILELMASCYPNTIGLRIFPVYGPGGESAISQWCRGMINNVNPVVYGDGNQIRDFIYIDDVIDQIMLVLERGGKNKTYDIGAGAPKSFNEIIEFINEVLGKNIKPIYKPAPPGYSAGISCKNPLSTKTSLREGIKKICDNL